MEQGTQIHEEKTLPSKRKQLKSREVGGKMQCKNSKMSKKSQQKWQKYMYHSSQVSMIPLNIQQSSNFNASELEHLERSRAALEKAVNSEEFKQKVIFLGIQ